MGKELKMVTSGNEIPHDIKTDWICWQSEIAEARKAQAENAKPNRKLAALRESFIKGCDEAGLDIPSVREVLEARYNQQATSPDRTVEGVTIKSQSADRSR